ncbi:MAG: dihydrofolate reductase [Bacteroidetes bacterium]|nr:dihydrofolate reductase [Bacteroidota bacterium]
MEIIIIVAATENNAIGKDNRLLWRLPDDMKFFKEKTEGHCVITGRRNYESIPEKFRPLPGRTNIVVTRQTDYAAPGAIVVGSLEAGISVAREQGESICYIIGGGEIYLQAMDLADSIWLTRVYSVLEADTFFPELDAEWQEVERIPHAADEKHAYAFDFIRYEKQKSN